MVLSTIKKKKIVSPPIRFQK